MNSIYMKENKLLYHLHPRFNPKVNLKLRKIKLFKLAILVY